MSAGKDAPEVTGADSPAREWKVFVYCVTGVNVVALLTLDALLMKTYGRPLWAGLVPPEAYRGSLTHAWDLLRLVILAHAALSWVVAGGVLAALRQRNSLGWLLLLLGTLQVSAYYTPLALWQLVGVVSDDLDEAYGWSLVLNTGLTPDEVYETVTFLSVTVLLALYPEGRLPSWRWRWPVAGVLMGSALSYAPGLYTQAFAWCRTSQRSWGLCSEVPVVLEVAGSAGMAISLLCGFSIWLGTVRRLFQSRRPQRQQLAWLSVAVVPVAVLSIAEQLREYGDSPPWTTSDFRLQLVATVALPLAITVGVLRYRLLGIEVVLRRGLVYGTLTVVVVLVYLSVTTLVGLLVAERQLSVVLAAGIIAVGLAPVRTRVQRGVDRFVYGERADPFEAVRQLGQGLAVHEEANLLDAALRSVADAVSSPAASVVRANGEVIARFGASEEARLMLPLDFGGRRIAALYMAPRQAGGSFDAGNVRLLSALALQLAVVVRLSDLTQALEQERYRVVAAIRSERDRLREDLHDGLGPSLSGVALGLQAVRDMLTDDDALTSELVTLLQAEVNLSVTEIRRITDGLRPAALDTMNLLDAITRYASTLSARLAVRLVAASLPPLPPDVETAAYRICVEALHNVVRHAAAHEVVVDIKYDDTDSSLLLKIADDGTGAGAVPTRGGGLGLQSMRRRAESLGGRLHLESSPGGTTVSVSLPMKAV